MNAAWDLAGRLAGKPVWRLLADMTPEQLVDIADLRYLADVLPRERALEILRKAEPGKAERIADLEAKGYPAYTTAAGPGLLRREDAAHHRRAGATGLHRGQVSSRSARILLTIFAAAVRPGKRSARIDR